MRKAERWLMVAVLVVLCARAALGLPAGADEAVALLAVVYATVDARLTALERRTGR